MNLVIIVIITHLYDRKYLQHVADKVSEWTKEEDVKQEAVQRRSGSPAGSPKGTEAQSKEPDVAGQGRRLTFFCSQSMTCFKLCKHNVLFLDQTRLQPLQRRRRRRRKHWSQSSEKTRLRSQTSHTCLF